MNSKTDDQPQAVVGQPTDKPTMWSDLSTLEQAEAATRLVEGGLTYRAAAAQLGTTVGAIAGALHRAPTTRKRAGAPPSQKKSGETKSRWTEARLTEPWARWREKRRAARLAQGSDAR